MNQDLFCFQRLKAYQHAKAGLKVIVDNAGAFRGLPGDLGPQMHHAAVSTALNIAEGNAKLSVAEKRRLYQIALGSANEVAACADIAELHRVDAQLTGEIMNRMDQVRRILLALCGATHRR